MLKKTIALILCAVVALCLFAGCNKQDAASTTPGTTAGTTPGTTVGTTATTSTEPTTNIYEESTPAGTLYLTFGAAIEIIYDDEGRALQISGKNEAGKAIANACQNQLGKECVFAARAILRYTSDNQLVGDAKTVAVRVGKGEATPDAEFLDTIVTDCQYLVDEECAGLRLVKIGEERLTEDGELTLDAAKRLAFYFLNIPEADITGNNEPVDGVYTLTGGEKSCTVDAFTGMVTAK